MALLLTAAVAWGYKMTPMTAPCVCIDYTIADADERLYLTENELELLLRAENLHPVGKALNSLSLHRIERAVAQHPMVRTAECYLTPRNEVRVTLTQRVPVLRVQTMNETYLIDTDRRVMQARATVRDQVPLVTGTVGIQMATNQLADFAEWLKGNAYWRARIHHLQVKAPHMVYIYLKDENGTVRSERVLLGSLNDYERKLAKLRIFLENGSEATQNQQYSEIDLRFHGQVIGRH